jgi:phosphoadenosine phosphosulfate reductase
MNYPYPDRDCGVTLVNNLPNEATSAPEILQWALGEYGSQFAISTSFQSEGMVLIDMASRISNGFRVITLDTGRLPEETHTMIETVYSRYGVRVEIAAPDADEVSAMVAQHGTNLFYHDAALRMLCCRVRKILPLERKLAELGAYAVGLRRAQSDSRSFVPKVERKGTTAKLSPLADWSKDEVEEYTAKHRVPRHPLYERGYTSIGCGPCTRATLPGEHERAGRWWWEDGVKECGLHYSANGKAERRIDVLLREVQQARSNAAVA